MPMRDFFALYDALTDGISSDAVVSDTLMGERWTAVETDAHFGMAMTTPVDTAPPDAVRVEHPASSCHLKCSG